MPEGQSQTDPARALPEGGTVRPVIRWGEPVMHRTLEPVTAFDDGLRALVADMVATMYAADGVGLAACQIGVDRAVFVLDCPDDVGVRHTGVVCNPVLYLPEGRDRRLDEDDEGCLSLPGAFVPCARPDYAEVRGQDLTGAPLRMTGTGLLARCLQHETDHCRGTVFGDRLGKRVRKRLYKEHDRTVESYPAWWPAAEPGPDLGS
jgi:peptide deformylase